jgi:hypothetical protein
MSADNQFLRNAIGELEEQAAMQSFTHRHLIRSLF